jgi:hypothetical protein
VIYDDARPRLNFIGSTPIPQTTISGFDTVAWSNSDQLLTSAPSAWDWGDTGPLAQLQVNSSGVTFLGAGATTFNTAGGYIHSDFGTGLIYSDGGEVANPNSGAIVGNYGASGLVVPDSSLNRVFILGQTAGQANTSNYSIESFDQTAFTPVSSITLTGLAGTPIAFARWGSTGLAVLTMQNIPGEPVNGVGMLYLLQNASFVSSNPASSSLTSNIAKDVRMRWKQISVEKLLERSHQLWLDRPR